MPSSRLFELLAEAKAKPSGAFQGAMSAIDAGNKVAGSVYDYQRNKRMDTKLSAMLGDTSYGDMTLRDVADKNSGLFELLKLKAENLPVDVNAPTYDEKGNPTGLVKIGTESKRSKIVQPTNVNIYRGKEFEHKVGQDRINNLQEEKKTLQNAKKYLALGNTGIIPEKNQAQYNALSEREQAVDDQLERLGIRTKVPMKAPPTIKPSAPASPSSKFTVGQEIVNPSTGVRLTWNGAKWVPKGGSK